MKKTIGTVAAIFLGVSLISVGITTFVTPGFASEMFGIPIADNSGIGYVSTTGLRDIALGFLLLALIYERVRVRVLGTCLMIFALIPIGDAFLVWMNADTLKPAPLSLHIASAIVFVVLGGWLRAGGHRENGADTRDG